MNATATDTEFLEKLIEDDAKCESEHHGEPCTHKVTHLSKTGCYREAKVCEVATARIRAYIANPRGFCGYCLKGHADCHWTIRPI